MMIRSMFFLMAFCICGSAHAITKEQCIANYNNPTIQCFSDPGCWNYDGSWTGDLKYCNGNGNCYYNCY